MREIKFREWNGFEMDYQPMISMVSTASVNDRFVDNNIMQFTGLKDANGVDIYEGDIFHMGDKNILYIVEWLDCGLKGRQISNKSCVGLDYWNDKIKIVGNLYENPELLNS